MKKIILSIFIATLFSCKGNNESDELKDPPPIKVILPDLPPNSENDSLIFQKDSSIEQ